MSKWSECTTLFLPGDLVRTAWGLAVIKEADEGFSAPYSVWHLPGAKVLRKSWGKEPPKMAWFTQAELELIERGPASKLRLKA